MYLIPLYFTGRPFAPSFCLGSLGTGLNRKEPRSGPGAGLLRFYTPPAAELGSLGSGGSCRNKTRSRVTRFPSPIAALSLVWHAMCMLDRAVGRFCAFLLRLFR